MFRRSLIFFWSALALSAPTKPKSPIIVMTENVQEKELFDTLSYPARIIPKVSATLLSEIDGVVKKIVRPLGSQVGVGDTVLMIVNPDPVYSYEPYRATTPVRGAVNSLDVTEGSRVTRGQKLGTVTSAQGAKLQIELASEDLASVKIGSDAEVILGNSERSLPAKVIGVSPSIDPITGTATAELHPDAKSVEPGLQLAPGALAKVQFKANLHRGVEIPDFAIVYRGPNPHVRIIEEKKAKLVPVTLGETRRGMVEVKSGLKPGLEFVVRTSQFVSDGDEVEVQKEKAGNT